MPFTVFHSKTATTPDVTATNATVTATAEIRPSWWNDAHVGSLSLAASEVLKSIVVGTNSQSSGNVTFSNSNGISFGLSAGVLTASHNAITSQSVQSQGIQAVSAGGNSLSVGSLIFSNANGVAFGLNSNTLTASYTVPVQSNQTLGLYASSQTTGASSSSAVDARSLTVVGRGNISVGLSAGQLVISGEAGSSGTAPNSFNILAAGTQTAGTATTVQFANSNGITFGMSGNAQITASHNALTAQLSQIFSAANGSSSFQVLEFADANNVSFSNINGSVVASIPAPIADLAIFGAGNTTGDSSNSTLPLSSFQIQGAGGVSVGFSDSTLIISGATGGGGGGGSALTQYAIGNTAGDQSSGTQALSSFQIRGAGVASVGYSTDGAIVVSVPAGGGGGDGGNVLIAGTQTAASLGSVRFADSNGVTFGMSASSQITATVRTDYASSNHSHGNPTLALTNLSGTTNSNSAGFTLSLSAVNAITTARASNDGIGLNTAGSNITWTANSSGISIDARGYAGTNTTFNGTNVSASMTLNSNGLRLDLSGPAAGGGGTLSVFAVSNTTQGSSGTIDARSLSFAGAGVASVGVSNGSVIVSVPAGGGEGDGGNVIAAGGVTATSYGTVVFANSNGLSFGLNGSTQLTASHNGLTSQSNQALSAANGSFAFQTANFSNANGVSFGTSAGSAITASVAAQSNQSMGFFASSQTTGQSSSSTMDARSVTFRGAGLVSVGLSAGEILISATSAAPAAVSVSAANGSYTVGNISFSNANGVSFGTSAGSAITASVAAQTNQQVGLYAVSNTTQSSSGTVDARSLSFAGAGAASVGVTNGSVVVSVAAGAQSVQTLGIYASSQTTGGASSSTYDARSLSVVGAGIVSVGWTNGSLVLSATAPAGGGGSGVALSAAGSSQSNGNVVFSNSNGVSFGMNGSTVTASHNGLTTAAQSNHSHGNPTLALTNLSGTTNSASNGLTLSLSAASQTAQSLGIYGLGNTTGASSSSTYDARSLSFVGGGIISIGQSNGSVQISAPAAVDFTQLSVGNSNLGNTAGDTGVVTARLVLVGSNNITLSGSTNGGSQTLSIIGAAGGGGAAISAAGASASNGTVVFSNSNGVSFGMNGSTVTASHNGLTTAAQSNHSHGNPTLNLTNLSGTTGSASNGFTLSLSAQAQSNQSLGGYAVGNTTAQSSSSTFDARSMSIQGAGGVSVGFSAGSLVISGATGGGGGGGVAISAGANSQSTGTVIFSNANGISFGLNGGTITATVNPGAAAGIAAVNNSNTTYTSGTIQLTEGGGAITIASGTGQRFAFSVPATSSIVGTNGISLSTNGSTISIGPSTALSRWINEPSITQVGSVQGNSLVSVCPVQIPAPLDMSNLRFGASVAVTTAGNSSSAGFAMSVSAVLYSRNGSTLSSVLSGSNAISASWSSNATGSVTGPRGFTLDWASSTRLQPGEYWVALHVSTATSYQTSLGNTLSMMVGASAGSAALGMDPIGQAAASSRGAYAGLGVVSTGASMASIPFSGITQSGTRAMVAKLWLDFRNYSVW